MIALEEFMRFYVTVNPRDGQDYFLVQSGESKQNRQIRTHIAFGGKNAKSCSAAPVVSQKIPILHIS